MHDKGSWRHLRTEEDDDVETELEEEGLDNLLLGLVVLALPHGEDDDGVHDHGGAVQTVGGVDLLRWSPVKSLLACTS